LVFYGRHRPGRRGRLLLHDRPQERLISSVDAIAVVATNLHTTIMSSRTMTRCHRASTIK
jgi:hypothetical protein